MNTKRPSFRMRVGTARIDTEYSMLSSWVWQTPNDTVSVRVSQCMANYQRTITVILSFDYKTMLIVEVAPAHLANIFPGNLPAKMSPTADRYLLLIYNLTAEN